ATFVPVVPGIAMVFLLGRLAGAFVFAQHVIASESSEEAAVLPEPIATPHSSTQLAVQPVAQPVVQPSPSAASPGASTQGFELIKFVRALAQRAETDLDGVLAEAEALRKANPRAAGLLAELCKLYVRADRQREAVATATEAISLAVPDCRY
ncbi:unnamed protein product, partial [marine sediment metagenome]